MTTFAEDERQQMFYFAGDFLLDRFRRFFSWGVASSSVVGRKRQRVLLTSTKPYTLEYARMLSHPGTWK